MERNYSVIVRKNPIHYGYFDQWFVDKELKRSEEPEMMTEQEVDDVINRLIETFKEEYDKDFIKIFKFRW